MSRNSGSDAFNTKLLKYVFTLRTMNWHGWYKPRHLLALYAGKVHVFSIVVSITKHIQINLESRKKQVFHKWSALSPVVPPLKVVSVLASMHKHHLIPHLVMQFLSIKTGNKLATTTRDILSHKHIYEGKEVHIPNHLMFGSTLATVPGATVDWYCKGLMTFPRLLLETEDQCEQRT